MCTDRLAVWAAGGLCTLMLAGCGGSSSHGGTRARRGERSRFTVVVADATPSGPGSVTQMNYATIAAKTRPTMVQALRIATQVAHRHSVVVKHVYCRPAPTGWACDYIR